MAAEQLPAGFRRTAERVCAPMAETAEAARRELGRTVVIGLSGPQGSGKTTIAAVAAEMLRARGLSAAVLSLDDLYLSRAARAELARTVHPLLATRGPPGTHDPALGAVVLAGLAEPGEVALPRFDKSRDEPAPDAERPQVTAPVDVALFEGWCVGARAQPEADLRTPINALERDEDPDGRWRTFVNVALAGAYRPLFGRIDRLVLLTAPSFSVVAGWRAEQEAKLRARTGGGMAEAEIARFVAHYERLTRWIAEEAPARADLVVRLAEDRTPLPA